MTSRTGSVGWDLRKSSDLSSCLGGRSLTFGARRGQTSSLRRGPHVVGGRWKSQHRKIVPLFPHVEKPLTKRWIKVSYLNQFREFCIFGIPIFYIYEYKHSMYVSRIRISGRIFGPGNITQRCDPVMLHQRWAINLRSKRGLELLERTWYV